VVCGSKERERGMNGDKGDGRYRGGAISDGVSHY
jgi:hypothetical protein